MRNNPKLDELTECYMNQVMGQPEDVGMVVLDIEPSQEEHCPHAQQGCTCGNCPECSEPEVEDGALEPEVVKDCIVKLEDLLQSLHRLYGCEGDKSQFNMGHEDVAEL